MGYDELSYEELKKEQNMKILDIKEIDKAIEQLKLIIRKISDIPQEGIEKIYESLLDNIDELEEVKIGIKFDLEEITYNMEILEDVYDDYAERTREYWQTQFRPGEV